MVLVAAAAIPWWWPFRWWPGTSDIEGCWFLTITVDDTACGGGVTTLTDILVHMAQQGAAVTLKRDGSTSPAVTLTA